MKKQYVFLFMIGIILYIFYLISIFTYKEYRINSNIEYIKNLNNDIKTKILLADTVIKYKKSKAYKNHILKQEQSFKNKGESVIYFTTEKKYKTFTHTPSLTGEVDVLNDSGEKKEYNIIDSMTIFEKWGYFIFKEQNN